MIRMHQLRLSKITALTLILMLSLLASACSTVTPQGGTEEEVTAELTISPAVARAGKQVSLLSKVIGLKKLNDVELYYELKKDGTGKSKLIKVEGQIEGQFIGKWEPEESGSYDVIIHIINPDIHVIVRKEMTVEA